MRDDSTVPRKLTALENRAIVVEMRKDGYTCAEIARHLGISRQAVHKHEQKAYADLNAKQDEATKSYRTLQVQRLEAQHRRLTQIVNDPETHIIQKLAAEQTLLKVDERLSKKYGTDAPILIKSESSVTQDLTPEQEQRIAQLYVEANRPDGES